MSQENLHAYLLGVLSAECGNETACVHEGVSRLAREVWNAAMSSRVHPDAAPALSALDEAGVNRLRDLVSERFSPTAAGLLDRYLKSGLWRRPAETGPIVPPGVSGLYLSLLDTTRARLLALPDKPEETPQSTLSALWLAAAGDPSPASEACSKPLPELDSRQQALLHDLLAQRFNGIPLAHLTGRQRFMGLELNVGKAALVPRQETELVGSAALGLLQQIALQNGPRVIDVCTGVGNLAFALARYEPAAKVYASDLSPEAVALAEQNRSQAGLGAAIEFRQGDFLAPFADDSFYGNIDLLTCNPPYISSAKVGALPEEIIGHEPRLAFDGGPFGIRILQRLISEAPTFLRRGGWLAFEVGHGQGPAIMERLRRSRNFTNICPVEDSAGAVRAVMARANAAT